MEWLWFFNTNCTRSIHLLAIIFPYHLRFRENLAFLNKVNRICEWLEIRNNTIHRLSISTLQHLSSFSNFFTFTVRLTSADYIYYICACLQRGRPRFDYRPAHQAERTILEGQSRFYRYGLVLLTSWLLRRQPNK